MMKRLIGCALGLICAATIASGSAWGVNEMAISCGGTISGGGGVLGYQYTLQNTGAVPLDLTFFYVGTQDLNEQSYSNWTAPAGFKSAAAMVEDWTTLSMLFPGISVMNTSGVKTPHGVIPPAPGAPSLGGIVWTGLVVVNPGQTVTFGFDNPHAAWDMEWFAMHRTAGNSSAAFSNQPIAGPLGIYTHGYVHGPGTGFIAVQPTTFGAVKSLYDIR